MPAGFLCGLSGLIPDVAVAREADQLALPSVDPIFLSCGEFPEIAAQHGGDIGVFKDAVGVRAEAA